MISFTWSVDSNSFSFQGKGGDPGKDPMQDHAIKTYVRQSSDKVVNNSVNFTHSPCNAMYIPRVFVYYLIGVMITYVWSQCRLQSLYQSLTHHNKYYIIVWDAMVAVSQVTYYKWVYTPQHSYTLPGNVGIYTCLLGDVL